MHLLVERPGRGEIVAEGLLDDHAGRLRQPRLGEALDHSSEQERRDLEVEDGAVLTGDRRANPLVRTGVAEVPRHVGQPGRQAAKDVVVESLRAGGNRLASVFSQVLVAPVADRHPHDRAVEQPAALQPIQRAKGHHLREIPGDPENHEDIGGLRAGRFGLGVGGCWARSCRSAHGLAIPSGRAPVQVHPCGSERPPASPRMGDSPAGRGSCTRH